MDRMEIVEMSLLFTLLSLGLMSDDFFNRVCVPVTERHVSIC